MSTDLLIVGRGRLGRALADALRSAGIEVTLTPGRRPRAADVARAKAIVIAVPDPAIDRVAQSLVASAAPSAIVLHVAGSRGVEALAPLRTPRRALGVMHPLVSLAGARSAHRIARSTIVIDGDPRARSFAGRLAKKLGARSLHAAIHGPAYHAAAVIAANGSAALAAVAVDVLLGLGVASRDAERAVGALISSVGANVCEVGLPGALTGPIVRGDAATVAAHRAALAKVDPDAGAAYDAIAPMILAVAMRAGLDRKSAAAIERAINERTRSRSRSTSRARAPRRSAK